ncbi:MAG: hypothetical protein ABSE69_01535 [Roseiarcus sp.]
MTDRHRPMAQDSSGGLARGRSADAPEFATFWHGPLNGIAYGCLASFAHVGAHLRLYTYDDRIDPPRGVEVADARQVCPDQSLLWRYVAAGKPSLAKFADMFRYKLVRETGCCWVDTDIVCLRKPDIADDSIVFGRQSEAYGKSLINNAVLRLPPRHPLLSELVRRAEDAVDIDQPWGAIGPFLLTELAEKYGVGHYARDFPHFNPIEPDHFWKPLLPIYRDSVAFATRQATFLHLWGELIERSAYDKSACPPVGSFLYDVFQRLGTLDRFARVYDERELENRMAGWTAKDSESGRTALSH